MTRKVSIDFPTVHPGRAAALMIHHLQIAAALFEAVSENTTLDNLHRNLELEIEGLHPDVNPALLASRAFVTTIHNYYEQLDKETAR